MAIILNHKLEAEEHKEEDMKKREEAELKKRNNEHLRNVIIKKGWCDE